MRGSKTFIKHALSPRTILQGSKRINKLNLNFKYALILLGLSCTSYFHQIKVDEPILRAGTEFWVPTQHVFQFNGVELCHAIEEFGAIMGEHDFGAIILPTLEEDLSDLAHQLLGVHLSMAKRWSINWVRCTHHFNAFCLRILVRFFLVHETP